MQSLRAGLVQQQRLTLSPQLVQSIKLMALPLADLRERIYEEVALNPALEIVTDPSIRPLPESAPSGTASDGGAVSEAASAQLDLPDWSERSDGTTWGGDEASDEHREFMEGVLTRSQTLQEHLMQQLSLCRIPKRVLELAEMIVQNLNSDGFHSIPLTELLAPVAPVMPEDRDAALAVVRQLDPPGCACTDFHESLIVQAELMRPAGRTDPVLEKTVIILRDHFSLLEKGRPDALVRALSRVDATVPLTLDEAEDVFAIIRSLEPFPGRLFDSAPPAWVAPDVFVRRNDEGDFVLVMNEEEIPVLGVSPFFLDLERSPAGGEGRDFAHESLKEARWFIQSLHRRSLTILKVARVLLVRQKVFFERGPGHLIPLRLKDVAAETGLHEATISRATRGKYLQCEWGLFEMSRFFSGRVASIPASGGLSGGSGGEGPITGDLSREAVKELIRSMIIESAKPLSDQKIADRLAEKGIKLARRTVAKYRSELTIASSFDR